MYSIVEEDLQISVEDIQVHFNIIDKILIAVHALGYGESC